MSEPPSPSSSLYPPTFSSLLQSNTLLTTLASRQTAILRLSFTTKISELTLLLNDVLSAYKLSTSTTATTDKFEGFINRSEKVKGWVSLVTGNGDFDIAGVVTNEELENLRSERNRLKSELDDVRNERVNGGDEAMLKGKVKELKSANKKAQKEKKVLLEKLNEFQVGSEGGVNGSVGGGSTKDRDEVKKLKKEIKKLEGKAQGGPSGPPPGPPPPSPSPAASASSAAAEVENGRLKAQIEEMKITIDSLTKSKDSVSSLTDEITALKIDVKEKQDLEDDVSRLTDELASVKSNTADVLAKMKKEKDVEKAQSDEKITELTTRITKLKAANKGTTDKLLNLQTTASIVTRDFANLSKYVQSTLTTSLPSLLSDTSQQIKTSTSQYIASIQTLKKTYEAEVKQRKYLFNLVQELRGNIRVFCRCRPPTKKELNSSNGDESICVSFGSENEVTMKNDKGKSKNWEFDKVFDMASTQEGIYSEVSELVTSVMDGYNVCIFAYGQTGTGKTYTMNGDGDGANGKDKGVNTRALYELFDIAKKREQTITDVITVSVLEVYNEQIKDLLTSSGSGNDKKYTVREGPNGNYVPDLTTVTVTSLTEVIELLKLSDSNRSTAKTNMNEHSSRSHLILTCYIVSTNVHTNEVTRGKLHLIDLAGSERVGKSGAVGVALKEAQNINKSLSALGDVISARGQNQGHIPFRNSTLTQLLQDSLSSDSKTLMFVCISPVMFNCEEGFCSLNFAERARKVELGKAKKSVERKKLEK